MSAAIEHPWYVYTFFNLDGQELYIGKTDEPKRRFREHRRDKAWFPSVARRKVKMVDTEGDALTLEKKLIQELNPIHNVVHNGPPKKAPRLPSELPAPMRTKIKFNDLQKYGESEFADIMARCRTTFIEWEEPGGPSKSTIERFESTELMVRTFGLTPEVLMEMEGLKS